MAGSMAGFWALLAAWVIWALDSSIVRWLGDVPSLVLAGITLTFGGLSTIGPGIIALRRSKVHIPGAYWLLFAFYVVFCTALADLCYVAAVKNLNPGLVSVTLRSQLVIAVLLGIWILQERISRLTLVGIVVIMLGNILMGCYRCGAGRSAGQSALLGWLLALLAMLLWSATPVIAKVLLRRFTPLALSGLRLTAAGVLLLLLSLLVDGPGCYRTLNARQWLLFVLKGCIISGGAFTLYFYGLQRVKVSVASALEQLAPILTFFYIWLFFRESISLTEAAIVLLILCGALLAIAGDYCRQRDNFSDHQSCSSPKPSKQRK